MSDVTPSLEEQRLHIQASIDRALVVISGVAKNTISPMVLREIGGRETYLPSDWQARLPPLFNYILAACALSDAINA